MSRLSAGLTGLGGIWRRALLLGGLALVFPAACGKSDEPPPAGSAATGNRPQGGVFGGGTGGSSGTATGGNGEGGEAGVPNTLAPTVRITSPDALAHPDDGAVLVDSDVEVVCEVSQSSADGSEPVNGATVRLEMLVEGEDPSEGSIEQLRVGRYAARFILTNVPNGAVSFRCSASDESNAHTGTDSISTFVDHGPAVEVFSPLENSAHALKRDIDFSFTVLPDPLVDDDAGAEVDSVTLKVAGFDIELDDRGQGEYGAVVNLDSPEFGEPGTMVSVEIDATNARTPVAGENLYRYSFILDAEGPIVTALAPMNGDVKGGRVEVSFSVVDALSDVYRPSVAVKINTDEPVYYDAGDRIAWSTDGVNFTYRFYTSILSSQAQANILIAASDEAGNEADGDSINIYLDNFPPIVDLDPPLVREERGMSPKECSLPFDPVGPASPNDLDTVVRFERFRMLVDERTNKGDGQENFRFSGTNEGSAYLYLQPKADEPLLINNDTDRECDDIAKAALPLTQRLPFQHLEPIPPDGQPWWGDASHEPMGGPPLPSGCQLATEGGPPLGKCLGNLSDMSRVIRQGEAGAVPAIYGIVPLDPGACTGNQWEVGNYLPPMRDGWICVAGRIEDNAGNVGISRPLRLCYDDGVAPPPDCSGTPPTCTDECGLPPPLPEGSLFTQ
jgi:hypothetical protein